MLFYPAKPGADNYVRLGRNGAIEVHSREEKLGTVEKLLLRSFRKIGYYGAPFMCLYPKMGSGFIIAGMLPMKDFPGRYQTDRQGRLFGAKHVFVVDGACFSALPSKNLTFTIMANSMRIADSIKKGLSG